MKPLTLADIMTRKVVEIDPQAALVDAAAMLECAQISSLLVARQSVPLGILTERDILRAMHRGMPADMTVDMAMSKPVVSAPQQTPIFEGYHLLAQRNIRHLVVTDERGVTGGIVSQSDFRFHLGAELLGRLRNVRSLMSTYAPSLSRTATVAEAVGLMERDHTSCVVVAEAGRPIGMLTERDITRLYRQQCDTEATLLDTVMTWPVETVSAEAPPQQAIDRMHSMRMRHLIVVDECGLIVGLLTERHLVGHLDEVYVEHTIRAMRQAQASLELSETRRQAVWEQAAEPMALLTPEGSLIECNPAAASLVSAEPRQMAGKPFWDTPWWSHDSGLQQRVRQAIDNTLKTGADGFEALHPLPGVGSVHVDYSFQPIRNSEGRVVLLMVRGEDVTDRRRAEDDLRLAASVFAHTHEGIVITDPAGTIVAVNDAFTALTGYTQDEAAGHHLDFLDSGHQDAIFYRQMWDRLALEGHWHGEVWHRRKNGDLLAELLTVSAVTNPQGTVTHYVIVFADITTLKENQEELTRLAHYDALTGLPNRVLLADRMRHGLAHARRKKTLLAVGYLDLDGFKPVNDNLGHAVGDMLLVEIAARLTSCVRGDDTVARLGGDEFAILLSEVASIKEIRQVAARVLESIVQPMRIGDHDIRVSGSLGIALFPRDGELADSLLKMADAAMYAAKQAGRNGFRIHEEIRAA